ncbi:LysR family transcriptional regulator [Klebsiella pneumoniae]|nr:LysR family transcriptional regulator [Klebsiella pneumoniae]OVX45113.1 LysR family transcriptional regulator [Klebsiella pneumoniae]
MPNIVRTGTFPVVPPFRRVAAAPYPARGSCGLSLIYPLARLKLPVLAASKSLRRSRKAGAARMDAG